MGLVMIRDESMLTAIGTRIPAPVKCRKSRITLCTSLVRSALCVHGNRFNILPVAAAQYLATYILFPLAKSKYLPSVGWASLLGQETFDISFYCADMS